VKIRSPYFLRCESCGSAGWVCALHRDRPWDGPRACGCGRAGVPYPTCNLSAVRTLWDAPYSNFSLAEA
jgi:hypothetical protein